MSNSLLDVGHPKVAVDVFDASTGNFIESLPSIARFTSKHHLGKRTNRNKEDLFTKKKDGTYRTTYSKLLDKRVIILKAIQS